MSRLTDFLQKLFGISAAGVGQLPVKGRMPEFTGLGPWISSLPLTREGLAGRVVLVDFWTYSCVNCLRTLPYVNAWHQAYAEHGLTVIGVHTPEFPFEKSENNVRSAVRRLGVEYPVVMDNDYALWHRYRNHYWPAHYFVDAFGNVRANHFGEGGYGHSEEVIRQLLKEAGREVSFPPVSGSVKSMEPSPAASTPETYLGYNRMEYLGSPEGIAMDRTRKYSVVDDPTVNIFYFGGQWELQPNFAIPRESGARVVYRVKASEINLVMDVPENADGQGADASQPRILVRLDDRSLSDENAGSDVVVGGDHSLRVTEGRMYSLVRVPEAPAERLVEVTFLDPGVRVYAFTFG